MVVSVRFSAYGNSRPGISSVGISGFELILGSLVPEFDITDLPYNYGKIA